MDANHKFQSIDEYISVFPDNIKRKLELIRELVKKTAVDAQEVISYNMPAFKFHGILLYFAAHKEHIGFYPGSAIVNEFFKEALIGYETSKGTIRFPIKDEIPQSLIIGIVKYKMEENLKKLQLKKEVRKKSN